MDWKSFFYGSFSVMFLILIMASFGLAHIGSNNSITGNVIASSDPMAGHHSGGSAGSATQSGFENIPQKCRPPQGQDLASWKEHMGHHTETQECVKYF